MNFISAASGRPAAGTAAWAALFGALLILAGCSTAERATTGMATLPAPGAPPQDPLGRFLAGAAPGQEGMVVMADGRAARVRVVRAYAAASGRECREVLVGEGLGGRASLLCQTEGQWVVARPLLHGSGTARP